MLNILHKVGINAASPNDAYEALTTIEGLSSWWTTTTRGDSSVGGVIHFQFGELGFFDIKVLELDPGKRVLWQVIDGPPEWIGTKIDFELKQADGFTTILFKHLDWPEPGEFMHHCSTKWAVFLLSLKSLVETGKGAAYPNDVKIDSWN